MQKYYKTPQWTQWFDILLLLVVLLNRMRKLIVLFFPFLLLTANHLLSTVQAQTPGLEATSVYEIFDKEALDGDIVVTTDQGLIRANKGFDNKMFGVVTDKPILVLQDSDSKGKPVIRSGASMPGDLIKNL